ERRRQPGSANSWRVDVQSQRVAGIVVGIQGQPAGALQWSPWPEDVLIECALPGIRYACRDQRIGQETAIFDCVHWKTSVKKICRLCVVNRVTDRLCCGAQPLLQKALDEIGNQRKTLTVCDCEHCVEPLS